MPSSWLSLQTRRYRLRRNPPGQQTNQTSGREPRATSRVISNEAYTPECHRSKWPSSLPDKSTDRQVNQSVPFADQVQRTNRLSMVALEDNPNGVPQILSTGKGWWQVFVERPPLQTLEEAARHAHQSSFSAMAEPANGRCMSLHVPI